MFGKCYFRDSSTHGHETLGCGIPALGMYRAWASGDTVLLGYLRALLAFPPDLNPTGLVGSQHDKPELRNPAVPLPGALCAHFHPKM